ncbi:MAG: hypothetical protein IPL70_19285 [Uliginosibacterium sp.]|nr:hypothetical protein [Uliginosibacterium sp.]
MSCASFSVPARLPPHYNMRTESPQMLRPVEEIGAALSLPSAGPRGLSNSDGLYCRWRNVHAQAPEFRINIAVSAEVNRIIDKGVQASCSCVRPSRCSTKWKTAGRHDRWTFH